MYFAWKSIVRKWRSIFGPIKDPGSVGFKSREINIFQMARFFSVNCFLQFSNRLYSDYLCYTIIIFSKTGAGGIPGFVNCLYNGTCSWESLDFFQLHYKGSNTRYFVLFVCLMVLNTTFNNISVISWLSVLFVKETGGPNDKLYHIMLYTSPWSRFKLTTSVVIGTDCIHVGSCKSNYSTIRSRPFKNWR